jgi:hypothetical protein
MAYPFDFKLNSTIFLTLGESSTVKIFLLIVPPFDLQWKYWAPAKSGVIQRAASYLFPVGRQQPFRQSSGQSLAALAKGRKRLSFLATEDKGFPSDY